MNELDEVIGKLSAAALQISPQDDQIIADHIRDSVALLLKYRQKHRTSRERDDIMRVEAYDRGVADTKVALNGNLDGLNRLKEPVACPVCSSPSGSPRFVDCRYCGGEGEVSQQKAQDWQPTS